MTIEKINYKWADVKLVGNETKTFRLESWDVQFMHYRVHVITRDGENYEMSWWHNYTNHYLGKKMVSKSVYDLFVATSIGEEWKQIGVQSHPSLAPKNTEVWLDGKLFRTLPDYVGTEGLVRHIYQCGGLECELTVSDNDAVEFRIAIKDANKEYHTIMRYSYWRKDEREYPDYFWDGHDQYLIVKPRRDGTLTHDLYSRL